LAALPPPTGDVLTMSTSIRFYVRPAPTSKNRKRADGGESGEAQEEKEEEGEDMTPDRDKGYLVVGADDDPEDTTPYSLFRLCFVDSSRARAARFIHALLAGASSTRCLRGPRPTRTEAEFETRGIYVL
jgi:hypothetical protein